MLTLMVLTLISIGFQLIMAVLHTSLTDSKDGKGFQSLKALPMVIATTVLSIPMVNLCHLVVVGWHVNLPPILRVRVAASQIPTVDHGLHFSFPLGIGHDSPLVIRRYPTLLQISFVRTSTSNPRGLVLSVVVMVCLDVDQALPRHRFPHHPIPLPLPHLQR